MTVAVNPISVDEAAAHVVVVWRRLKEMGVEPTHELVRVALEHARDQARGAAEDERMRVALSAPKPAAAVMKFTPESPGGAPAKMDWS